MFPPNCWVFDYLYDGMKRSIRPSVSRSCTTEICFLVRFAIGLGLWRVVKIEEDLFPIGGERKPLVSVLRFESIHIEFVDLVERSELRLRPCDDLLILLFGGIEHFV